MMRRGGKEMRFKALVFVRLRGNRRNWNRKYIK